MIEDETPVQVYRRNLSVAIEGLTPMEISAVASLVTTEMEKIESETKTADTSKLAILAALSFAAELHKLKQQSGHLRQADEKRISGMISILNSALGKDSF